jgi:hypothetical protein
LELSNLSVKELKDNKKELVAQVLALNTSIDEIDAILNPKQEAEHLARKTNELISSLSEEEKIALKSALINPPVAQAESVAIEKGE